ncbi:unknown [Prevotella sp. CAG:487]|nr:unknown [Prevotella sp. CAG:487]
MFGTDIRIRKIAARHCLKTNIYAIRTVKNHYSFLFQKRKQKPFRASIHTILRTNIHTILISPSIPSASP